MCSREEARLAAISAAIDEVAASARTPAAGGIPTPGAMADVTARLAAIWAMLAELDPALATRLPGYTARRDEAGGD